jgi:hypothetical protein
MGGGTDSFDRITILYGKNSGDVTRTHTLHQDGSLFKEVDVVAHMVPAPMLTADKRFVWLDLAYAVREVYFPFCFSLSRPYEELVQMVRLNFTQRAMGMPFVRPWDPMLHSQSERELLPVRIEKAVLEIMYAGECACRGRYPASGPP